MRIVLTGATGFIGSALLPLLREHGHDVRLVLRRPSSSHTDRETMLVPDFTDTAQNWLPAVEGCDTVIHLAGLAHVLNKHDANDPAPFFAMNHDATLALARAAAAAGVKHFIFMSSIGVHGTRSNAPLTEHSPIAPVTPYAESKAAAEDDLRALCVNSGMAFTIIRPPLVYGAGAGGNFARLIKLVGSGLPLPFGRATSPRSIISCSNLNHFILHCLENHDARNEVFVVADAESTSTRELAQQLAQGMGKHCWLLPIPACWMRGLLCKLGRASMADGLFSMLEVDMRHARKKLGWTPPYGQRQEIQRLLEQL